MSDEAPSGPVTEDRDDPEPRAAPEPETEPGVVPEVVELEGRLLRSLADLDNLRRRFDREVVRERASERARVAAAWLPVVDDLERALEHAAAEEGPIIDGVRSVHEHALAVLARLGFPRFDDLGELFDPHRDEAVGSVEAVGEAGTVVATPRAGYGEGEQILRPASVVVARPAG